MSDMYGVEATLDEAVEGISVRVVGPGGKPITEADARIVGPILAAQVYPKLKLGSVLHSEPHTEGGWEVIVRDMTNA